MKWSSVRLGDIAITLQPGFACQPTDDPSGVPQLRTNNVSTDGRIDLSEIKRVPRDAAEIERYLLRPGDVLFNNTNSPALVGKTALFDEPGEYAFSNHMTRIRLQRALINPRYAARFLHWAWGQGALRTLVTQWVNQAAINRSQLASVTIPLPPLSEQRRIVEILDRADHLRRLRAEADAKADRILPALLTKALGPVSTWDSDPRSQPLGELVDFMSGGTPSKKNERLWNGEIPWVSPKDMKEDFIQDTQDHVSQDALAEAGLQTVQPENVLLVVRGMILARTVPVALNLRPVTINQDMKALVPKGGSVTGRFLWGALFLARTRLITLVRTAGHGTRKLDTPDLLNFSIVVPSAEQRRLVEGAVRARQTDLENRSHAQLCVTRLFSNLLDQAFSGKLTASWREAHMKDLLQEMEHQAKVLAATPQAE